MANVIHIRRQPTGLEQAGQSMQELANNFIQHTLAMAQQQNAQNMQLMGLGMQERRMADANARDDRRWKESTAMQERRFAQEDKWRQAQLDLQKQQLGRSYAAMDKPQLTQIEGPYGNKISVWVNPRTQQITPASIPGMEGDTGGGIPGLDGAFNAAMNEVGQPGFGAVGEGMTSPTLASAHTADPLARAFDLLGVKFPQSEQPQQIEAMPEAPAQEAQIPTVFAPGTVVDGSGNPVQLPANVPWGKQEKQYVGGKEYYGTRTPNGLYFKIGGEVPPSAAERKDLQAIEKNEKAERASVSGGMTIADAAIRSADDSLKLLDEYGGMATGSAAQSWLGEGTLGRKIGLGQGMADLHRALQPMQTATMLEMIKEMKNQSPSGALNMRITQLEAVMLSGILGSLEIDQSPEQLRKNIIAHKEIYQQTMNALADLAKEKGHPIPGHIRPSTEGSTQQGTSAQLPPGFRMVN